MRRQKNDRMRGNAVRIHSSAHSENSALEYLNTAVQRLAEIYDNKFIWCEFFSIFEYQELKGSLNTDYLNVVNINSSQNIFLYCFIIHPSLNVFPEFSYNSLK